MLPMNIDHTFPRVVPVEVTDGLLQEARIKRFRILIKLVPTVTTTAISVVLNVFPGQSDKQSHDPLPVISVNNPQLI